jgi:putative transposase
MPLPTPTPDRTVYRTYKYRAYPTRAQIAALEGQFALACDLWNAALEQRRDVWKRSGRSVRLNDQFRDLTELSQAGWLDGMSVRAARDPLRRLDRAFEAFYRGRETGEASGYPRFKQRSRYNSLTWPSGNGTTIRGGRLRLQAIGPVRIRWHREIPADAQIRTVTVERNAGRWYVYFALTCEPREVVLETGRSVGIDMGLATFAALSTGERIESPRVAKRNAMRIRCAQQRMSRRKHGSNRRRKAVVLLAKRYEHERCARRDHAHKSARNVAQAFDFIAIEDLQIQGINSRRNTRQKRGLRRAILDQGWGQFATLLTEKAEEAARTVVRVDPRYTSQICALCGHRDASSRNGQHFCCTACGHTDNADVNAAKNILQRAVGTQPSGANGTSTPLSEKPPRVLSQGAWAERKQLAEAVDAMQETGSLLDPIEA